MSYIHGSERGAEEFRQSVLKESRRIYQETKQTEKALKKAKDQCEEEFDALGRVFEKAVNALRIVLEQTADVTKQMQRYRDYIRSLDRTAAFGGACGAPRQKNLPKELLGKVQMIPTHSLVESERQTFLNGSYATVVTTEEIVLYRVFGRKAGKIGRFLTTQRPVDRLYSKTTLALDAQWMNSRTAYCEVRIPMGTVLNVGYANAQYTASGNLLSGGAAQILLSAEQCSQNAAWFGEEYPLDFVRVDDPERADIPAEVLAHVSQSNENGFWDGKRGDSYWIPADSDVQAQLHRYGRNSILYHRGYPDFEAFAAFETSLQSSEIRMSDRVQFCACSECLSDFWESVAQRYTKGEFDDPLESPDYRECLKQAFQCSDDQMEEIQWALENAETPYGYTWHHDVAVGKMLLVPTLIHAAARHLGGRSLWGGGRACR